MTTAPTVSTGPVPDPTELLRTTSGPKTITAAKIRELYDKGTNAIRDAQNNYKINARFIEADQWIFMHSTRQEILHLPRDPRRVRATIPRVGPESRRIMAKLLKRPLVFQVTPEAPDSATIRGARIAEAVLTHTSDTQDWDDIREDLAWGAWKGGTSILCLDWDSSAGVNIGIDPITNRVVGTGDVRVTSLAISEVAAEPGTRDLRRGIWWIKAQALPPSEVKRLYKLKADPPADANAANAPTTGRTSDRRNAGNLTLVLTYYERPNPDNTAGSVAVVVGNAIVDGPYKWPFPFTDRLNVAVCRETTIEGQWYGRTVISDAVPIQTALNASWTNALEHMKQAGNARMQVSEASQDLVEGLSDEAGEFIFYRDTPHTWVSPPQMPQWWIEMPQRLEAAMDDALGVHDVSRGNAPPNIESGLGLSILAEQDDTPTGKFAGELADAFGEIATLVLKTYAAKVKTGENRTAVVKEPGYISEKVNWSGDAFEGQTNADVPYDAVAPLNEAARFARGMAFLDRKIITDARQLSAYVDLPGQSNFIEAIDPNVAKARRENYMLSLNEAVIPATWDNHAIHIQEHNAFRMSARYERLPEQEQHLVDTHVQAHSTLAAEEMAKQVAAIRAGEPALAGAAQANQPPGSALPPGGAMPESGVLGGATGGSANGGGGQPSDAGVPPQVPFQTAGRDVPGEGFMV